MLQLNILRAGPDDDVERETRSRVRGALRNSLLGGGLGMLIAAGGPAHAKPTAPPAAPATSSSQDSEDGSIIVTAQRRSERLEDVPMAITAVTASAIQSRGIRNLQDLSQVTSGVQVNYAGSFTSVSVRGVSAPTGQYGSEGNVGVYVDGFYQVDNFGVNSDFSNVRGIEVLKGPQGTLYGRNSAGGAILISTLDPSPTFTGRAEAKYGTYDDKSLGLYVSGPVTPGLGFNLSVYGRKTPGYYDRLDANGQKIARNAAPMSNFMARGKIKADLSNALSATLGLNYVYFADNRGNMFTPENYRPVTGPNSLAPKVGHLYEPYTYAGSYDGRQNFRLKEATLTLKYKTSIGTLSSYTGYGRRHYNQDFDFDSSPTDRFYSTTHYDQKTFQQGVDFTLDRMGNFDAIVGGTYFDDKNVSVVNSISNGVLGSIGSGYGRSKAWAGFLDLTLHLSDRLTLNGGGRYTEETRAVRSSTLVVATQKLTGVPIDVTNKYTNFSPRASIRYEVANNTNLYASYSKGFRSGTVQGIATATAQLAIPIKPELVTAYEAGFKHYSRLFSLDVSAFYYDYRNIQVSVTIPNPLTGQPSSTLQNGTSAKIYGAETQLTFRPVRNLELDLSGTYLHARYGIFKGATAVGLNTTTMLNVSGQVQDLSGDQMIRAPNFSGTAAISYTFENVAGGKVLGSANVKYTDSYVVNNFSHYGPLAGPALANKQRFRQSGYALVNGSLTWTDASDQFSLGVWANNITNRKYRLSYNGGTYGEYGIWAWPRQVGVRAGVKW